MQTRMEKPFLEVTFRKGKVLAAYLHLRRSSRGKAARSSVRSHGMVVDFSATGDPLGVEITAPSRFDVDALNELLRELHVAEIDPADLAPLRSA
jgi:hypothetical protein